MTEDEFAAIFDYFVEASNGQFTLPHGIPPGAYPGGRIALNTRAKYNAYLYNPPQYFQELGFDHDASYQPTWEGLEEALKEVRISRLISKRRLEIEQSRSERIHAVFEVDNDEDELWSRLDGMNTPDRIRLKRAYVRIGKELKESLVGMSLEYLKAFDPFDDSLWTVSDDD